jgi:hypothetical protein
MDPSQIPPGPHYVIYDKASGEIIQTYSRLSVTDQGYVAVPEEEIKRDFAKDAFVVSRLTNNSIDNLDVIRVDHPFQTPTAAGRFAVDVSAKRLFAKPAFRLTSSKTELAGDGVDKTEIEVQALDADGNPVSDLEDDVRITTSRGKLSARGGLVKMVGGRVKIELTSVNETVHSVRVRAESLSGRSSPGEIVLEFL